jgi:inosine triphosphate pyrophosphatase
MVEAGKKIPITFITGNKGKLQEFIKIIGSDLQEKYEVGNMKIDLDEYQGEPDFIANSKVKLAATHCSTPVLIEDVSLCFNALKGLPGPYIKSFLDKLAPEGLHRMVSGFDDHSAYAQCIYAFCEGPGKEP